MTNEVQKIEQQEVAVVADTSPMGIIHQMVTSGQIDVETVKGLLDIQRSLEKQESIKSFNKNFALMRSEMPIFKREKDAHTTKYTPLEDIMKLAQPVLSKYGFSASFSTNQTDALSVSVTCDIMHSDGHSKTTSLILPIKSTNAMNPMQALGAAITYGKRYTLSGLLNIVTADDQDNNGFAESARKSKPKIQNLPKAKEALDSGKTTISAIMDTYDVSPEEMEQLWSTTSED